MSQTLTEIEKKLLIELGPKKEYLDSEIKRLAQFVSINGIKDFLREKVKQEDILDFELDYMPNYISSNLRKNDFDSLEKFFDHLRSEINKSSHLFDEKIPFSIYYKETGKGLRIVQKRPVLLIKETEKAFLKRFKKLSHSFYLQWNNELDKYNQFIKIISSLDSDSQVLMKSQYLNGIIEPKLSKESKISVKDYLIANTK